MDSFLELGGLFGRLATAASLTSICALLQQYAADFGLTRMAFFDLRRAAVRTSDAILCANVPSRVLRRLDRVADFAAHPVIARAREAHAPFDFSLPASLGFSGDDAHPDVQPVSNGLAIPLREATTTVAVATMAGARPVLSNLGRDKLKLAFHAGWHRAQELNAGKSTASTTLLTRRELECLAWVARGKTDHEIGVIVGVAPRTVRFHIDNAKTKLEVGSRVQAIAKLMRERPDLVKAR